MLSLALVAGATAACSDFQIAAARTWLDAQGCTNQTINSCPGGQTPEAGCTDAAYIARALAAGGALPLDPNSGVRSDYQAFTFNGTLYNLELAQDLQKVMALQGWARDAAATPATAEEGAIVFTTAYANAEGVGMPCWARGNNTFDCHEPPLLYGPNCGINADVLAYVDPRVWVCNGAPKPVPAPPTPAPAPGPKPCADQQCYPQPSAPYVCRANPAATDAQLQDALNYACSYGTGVDCAAINQGGACFDKLEKSVRAHADWAFDQYYQIQCPFCIIPVEERCNFNGAATLVKGPVACP